jgi:DNA-binding NarL/FixJ family response regulator
MLRAAFKSLLGQNERFQVLGDHGDPRMAIEEIIELQPDIVLMDITMPGLSGIDAVGHLRKLGSKAKIVMLSHHEGESFVEQSLKAGADGYLSKDSDPAELVLALEAVARGNPFLSPKVSAALVARTRETVSGEPVPRSRLESLTPREREVFQLLALGHSNKEVARDLGMSLGSANSTATRLRNSRASRSAKACSSDSA